MYRQFGSVDTVSAPGTTLHFTDPRYPAGRNMPPIAGVWRFASTAGTSELVQSIAVLAGGVSSNHRGPLAARGVQPLGTRRKASGEYDEGGFTGTTARHEEEIRRWVARSAPQVIARSP